MEPKDILENIDEFDLDNIELAKVDLDEMGKERIRKNFKNTIKDRRFKSRKGKIIVVSLAFGIFSTVMITTPAIASNIPIIGDVYKELGFFKGVEHYTNYIGKSKEKNGYKFTIDNIVSTSSDFLVGVKIESEVPFNKEDRDVFDTKIDMTKLGIGTLSNYSNIYYLDDKTAILTTSINTLDRNFKKQGEMDIKVLKYGDEGVEFAINFYVNIDFSSSFDKIETIEVEKDLVENQKIMSLEGTILGSKLWFEGSELFPNDLELYLLVDGEIHRGKGALSNLPDVGQGISNVEFETLNYDDIKNAKEIKLLSLEVERSFDDRKPEIKYEEKDGITYPSEFKIGEEVKHEIYDLKREDGKIKFYFKDNGGISPLNRFVLEEEKENKNVLGKFEYGFFYENPAKTGEFILEFNEIEGGKSLKLEAFIGDIEKRNIKNYKIIDIK